MPIADRKTDARGATCLTPYTATRSVTSLNLTNNKVMKDYQMWGFVYLNFGKENTNVITGTRQEAEEEHEIPCFDGISYFKFGGKCYVARYPKFAELTEEDKDAVKYYCGYKPEYGEFGVIMGALGDIQMVSEKEYDSIKATHQIENI